MTQLCNKETVPDRPYSIRKRPGPHDQASTCAPRKELDKEWQVSGRRKNVAGELKVCRSKHTNRPLIIRTKTQSLWVLFNNTSSHSCFRLLKVCTLGDG